jgi:hypothetical protein
MDYIFTPFLSRKTAHNFLAILNQQPQFSALERIVEEIKWSP